MRKREELGGNNSPLDSPVLKESMAQLSQSAQTNQQASQQYVTAATENQAATAQLTNAASQMTAAAAQMQAAVGSRYPLQSPFKTAILWPISIKRRRVRQLKIKDP